MTVRNRNRETNGQKIKNGLDKITEFLTSNEMVINQDKTHVTESMVYQKRCRISGTPPNLTTIDKQGNQKIVEDETSCRILGLQIQNDLGWRAHLEGTDKPLLPSPETEIRTDQILRKNSTNARQTTTN